MTPVHVAAMGGHVLALQALTHRRTDASDSGDKEQYADDLWEVFTEQDVGKGAAGTDITRLRDDVCYLVVSYYYYSPVCVHPDSNT